MMKTDRLTRCLLLSNQSGDWEAFYYGDECITQDHGIDRKELLDLSETYEFTRNTLVEAEASTRDSEKCDEDGRFPDRLSDLQDQYY